MSKLCADLIVFDLDGTLALNEQRQHHLQKQPKDWDAFFEACDQNIPNRVLFRVLRLLQKDGAIIEIWSGRSDAVKLKTKKWLEKYGLGNVPLKMRSAFDFRSDVKLKQDWLNTAHKTPVLVFDDRESVVRMWRKNGIKCFQVAEGKF